MNNNYYKKYISYKTKYLKLKKQLGGDNLETAINLIKDNYDFIFKEMYKHKKECYGTIKSDLSFEYKGAGFEIIAPPETEECFACWHTHPPLNVLMLPEDDIFFNPPSLGDIYYVLLGAVLKKYNYSFVVAKEGIYLIEPQSQSIRLASSDLKDIIQLDDPWVLPAEPIADERGEKGYDFHGAESEYPYLSVLLSQKISWNFNNFDDAFSNYKSTFEQLGIKIIFIPIN